MHRDNYLTRYRCLSIWLLIANLIGLPVLALGGTQTTFAEMGEIISDTTQIVEESDLPPELIINDGDASTQSNTVQVFIHGDGSSWIMASFFNSDKNVNQDLVDRYDGIRVYSDLDPTGIVVSAVERTKNSGTFQIQIYKKTCEEIDCKDLNYLDFMNDITIADLSVTPRATDDDKIIRVNALVDGDTGSVKNIWDEILFIEQAEHNEPSSSHRQSKQSETVPVNEAPADEEPIMTDSTPPTTSTPPDSSIDDAVPNTVILQIGTSPALEGVIQVNGKMVSGGMESFTFTEGQQIELVAKELIEYPDGIVYKFTQWSKGYVNSKIIVIVGSSEMVTAQYQLLYRLNIDSDVGLINGGGLYVPCSIATVSVEPPNQWILTAKDRFVEWEVLSTAPSNPECDSNTSDSTPIAGKANSDGSFLKMAYAQEQMASTSESISERSFSIVMDSPKRIQAVWSTDYTEVYLGIVSIGIPAGVAGVWALAMNQKMYWINLPILRWKLYAPNTIPTRGYTYIDIVIYNIGVSSAKNITIKINCSNNLECMNSEILIRNLLARESRKISVILKHVPQLSNQSDTSEVTLSLRGGSRIFFVIPYVQKLHKILHLKIAQLNIAFVRGEKEK